MTESSQGQFDPNLVQVFKSCGTALDRIFKENPRLNAANVFVTFSIGLYVLVFRSRVSAAKQ